MSESALLWCRKPREDLEGQGFKFNACDACIANGAVKGKQHTVRFHTDNLMSSHEDSKVNDDFCDWLNEKCGKCGEVKATRGKEHNYPGMTFRFGDGKVETDVTDHIKNVLEEFPIKFKEMSKNITPAGVDLFGEDASKKSSEEMKKVFHRTVAQGSFACKQS